MLTLSGHSVLRVSSLLPQGSTFRKHKRIQEVSMLLARLPGYTKVIYDLHDEMFDVEARDLIQAVCRYLHIEFVIEYPTWLERIGKDE